MIRDTSQTDRSVSAAPARTRRTIILIALAIVLLVTAAVAWPAYQRWSKSEASVDIESLRFATVERGDLIRDISVQGRVVAAVRPTLYSPANGTVDLLVQAGDLVTQNQALATVDSPEMRNRLEQERATLQSLEVAVERQRIDTKQRKLSNRKTVDMAAVALAAAEREMRRAEDAQAKEVISAIDYEKARDDLDKARLDHRHAVADAELQAEALAFELQTRELELDRQRLLVTDLTRQVGNLEITSPVDGIVGDLKVDQKAAVDKNQALLSVVDLGGLEVELDVDEVYADDLGLGMQGEITIGNDKFHATVTAVSPEVRDNQVTTRLRFDNELPDGLRQNQRVSARLLLDERKDVIKVRRGPFLDSGAGRVAFVRRGEFLERRRIETAPGSLREVQVLEGLEPGDVITISSLARFDNNDTILLTQ